MISRPWILPDRGVEAPKVRPCWQLAREGTCQAEGKSERRYCNPGDQERCTVARLERMSASLSAQGPDSAPDSDGEQDQHHNGQGESVGKGKPGPAQTGHGVSEKGHSEIRRYACRCYPDSGE